MKPCSRWTPRSCNPHAGQTPLPFGYQYPLQLSALSPRGGGDANREREGENNICTNVVVAGELRYGALKRGSDRLTAQLETILARMKILPLREPADQRYAELRTNLEKRERPIGPNDMLIAAHALALDYIIVTDNVREFSRVPGLRVENWLRRRSGNGRG